MNRLPDLPRRVPGASLPPGTGRYVGRAKVTDTDRWATDQSTIERLLEGLLQMAARG
jgi:hypothetical protein